MTTRRLILACALVTLFTGTILAQTTNSPYSRVAYGHLNDNASGIQRQMGGVGYAMQNGRAVNVMNPASYSQVDSLTFLWDVGLSLTNNWAKEIGLSGHNFGGALDYLTSQFRLYKHLGGSFGLTRYASVGYTYRSDLTAGKEERTGSGGLSQLYVGLGYEPFKGFSLGANVGYLFGNINNAAVITNTSVTQYHRITEVRDWNMTLGVQYGVSLGKKDRLTLGVTYSPKKSFHGHTWGTSYDSQDTKSDTIEYTSMKGNYEMPHTIGAGISYNHAGRWLAEVDFTYQNWAKVKYKAIPGFEDPHRTFNNRWKTAAGLQYSPNRRGSYVGSMAFRVGAFYNHDYLNISGNNVRDYGATLGVGLPVPGGKTTVNVGLEWLHRTSAPEKMITEDYLNISLSVNFNELWFWKNKIR